jgi:hypothetical protein
METMKSALFATIFLIVGGVGIFLAFPAVVDNRAPQKKAARQFNAHLLRSPFGI